MASSMEILIPEAVIVLFLVLPLLRPFVKKLRPLDGLVWLPLIALGITIGIFPAYGFRPECLPLLIFALIYSVYHLFYSKDSLRYKGPLLTAATFILLSAAAIPMFVFSPKVHEKPEGLESVTALKIAESLGAYSRDYSVRIYGDLQSGKPLIFLVPPEIGSVASVNLVCTELHKNNYTVVTYSCSNKNLFRVDKNSWIRSTHPVRLLTYWLISGKAAGFASVNEQGKKWEAHRRDEIEFLLSWLPAFLGETEHRSLPPFLLVGYGTGGSALAYLAGESDFIARHNNVRGVIAIESRLWSSYLPLSRDNAQPLDPNAPVNDWAILRYWKTVVNCLNGLRPQRISRTGPLPGEGRLESGVPVLYLLSGRALDFPKGQKPYQAVFDALRLGSGPVALAVIQEAGPLDYQDYPLTHPLYSFFVPGQKGADRRSADSISDTAGIIGNFASLVFNRPTRHVISGNLYVESKNFPGYP